jgi:hypothetical protein
MATGTLKLWNPLRGFGFIKDDTKGPDRIMRGFKALDSLPGVLVNTIGSKADSRITNCQHRFHCCSTVEGSW